MKIFIFLFSVVCFFLISNSTLSTWESLSIALTIFFFLEFLQDLGKKIVILYLPGLMALLTWLVMPVIFYHVYTKADWQAHLWAKYMPVSSDRYFGFVVPGALLFILGLRIPLGRSDINRNPQKYMDNVREYLKDKPKLGLILIGIGLASGVFDFLSPASLKQVFYLLEHLTYVGVFYVFYSPNKFKGYVSAGVIALTIAQALANGMFGELIFISSLSFILVMLGKKVSFRRKFAISIVGLFLVILTQSVKSQYRVRSWKEGTGSDPLYFAELLGDKITDPSSMLDKDKLFFIAVRLNQGWLVAVTMDRVPRLFPYANGETIGESVAASFVPRFLWPDKPEAGGKANLKRFWGFEIRNFSMNIGPIGEAYANFGEQGGIIYMFFYGLFFNFMLAMTLRLAEKTPTLILWLPFLFMYTITVESDLLMTMNSVMKATLFTWIVFKVFKSGFHIQL